MTNSELTNSDTPELTCQCSPSLDLNNLLISIDKAVTQHFPLIPVKKTLDMEALTITEEVPPPNETKNNT